ncbi:MAG: TrmH family RNA methyltransferase [Candidatus Cloacimonadota bacterium]|nr:MAG: TrmH family RNA methyltransferase [Candidatus Cloacimonadota bacterium]
MKFSEKKFLSFSKEKQRKILLEFIGLIETNWQNEIKRRNLISEFGNCLKLASENNFGKIAVKMETVSDLEEFLSLVVPLEQKFGKNPKDEDFLIFNRDGKKLKTNKIPLFLILDNLRSSFNVGSIFRTAECFGISELLLCGYTPTPGNPKVCKTAMGTEKMVKWQHFETLEKAIEFLRKKKIAVYALETTSNAKNISQIKFPKPLAIILGNEALGISKKTLLTVDEIVQIPLSGWKNSLNVGVSAAICCYEIKKQWESD